MLRRSTQTFDARQPLTQDRHRGRKGVALHFSLFQESRS